MTGDEISAGARSSGGTLYGGPLGFLGTLANMVIEEAAGKDIGGYLLVQFSGGDDTDGAVLAAADGKLAEATPAKDAIVPAQSCIFLVATSPHAATVPFTSPWLLWRASSATTGGRLASQYS